MYFSEVPSANDADQLEVFQVEVLILRGPAIQRMRLFPRVPDLTVLVYPTVPPNCLIRVSPVDDVGVEAAVRDLRVRLTEDHGVRVLPLLAGLHLVLLLVVGVNQVLLVDPRQLQGDS